MKAYEVIRRKRDGQELTSDELQFLINDYTQGSMPDYQMAAFLMATYFRGMSKWETVELTRIFIETGEVIKSEEFSRYSVDKHSTGGVGDKISLVLAPLVAAAGAQVPMMSGRGLGHTGGTLDKLESIPGFTTSIEKVRFCELVNSIGAAIVGQSEKFVPADKKIYALRDVTATVESIPLIASSIMSKKLAAGPRALVLDVKTGNGAFMSSLEQAETLAQCLVDIGNGMGRNVMALITDMNQPLGQAIGNNLEIKEVIQVLQGAGPGDVTELTLILGSWMLVLSSLYPSLAEARLKLEECLHTGAGFERFRLMVAAQGGDLRFIDDPSRFAMAANQTMIRSTASGWLTHIDTLKLGLIAVELGAGRSKIEDSIDHSVGMIMKRKLGDEIRLGEPLIEIHHQRQLSSKLLHELDRCFSISAQRSAVPPMVYKEIRQSRS